MCVRTSQVCRKIGSEGIVLLKNENKVLPLAKESTVSIFGRIQTNYIKSGTGSGGLVNTDYVIGIPEGLKAAGICVNKELETIYTEWEKENPFDKGAGWAQEPWSQVEMPLADETVKQAARKSDAAIVIVGRLSGEDRDNKAEEGSYLLTVAEQDMLTKVTKHFERVIVVLNVGNIIDMKWVDTYKPSAVLYVWQGGQEGGNSVADVLTGAVSPCGKLTDTIAYNISDYASDANFGDMNVNVYCEEIYVGYRYFNTYAREKVLYPFGYGLSYTTFSYEDMKVTKTGDDVRVDVTVKNIGTVSGKEIVQVYCSAPKGKLSKPERVLVTYAKTRLLAPGDSEVLTMYFSQNEVASYDDTGITGNKSCFVLEQGTYTVHISLHAEKDIFQDTFEISDTLVTEQCQQALSPMRSFEGIDRKVEADPVDLEARISANLPEEILQTEDRGIQLKDVKDGKYTMEEFIAQLTDEDLACIGFGEGMNSPKVTGGTGAAFGGVTASLLKKGIPIACATDGPSGIRMDCGAKATSIPSGTLLACTWNDALVEELCACVSLEMEDNNIDVLLAPGVNIHRHPLNGRNFEYFSEDPLLTGRMALAVCKGIARHGNTGTIKHFCCNNQEERRNDVDSVVSERALREIYLKPYEIVIKAGDYCKAIMTGYNPTNGLWTGGSYDLTTTILRDDWGYKGFVMSDWRAKTGNPDEQTEAGVANSLGRDHVPGAIAQNDIYMVYENASDYKLNNLLEAVKNGRLQRSVLQRNAINICNYLMSSKAMDRRYTIEEEIELGELVAEFCDVKAEEEYEFQCTKSGTYALKAEVISKGTEVSQSTAIFYVNGEYKTSITVCGDAGRVMENVRRIELTEGICKISVKYLEQTLSVEKVCIQGGQRE